MSPNRIIVARFSPTGRTRRLMSMIAQGLAGTALPVEELDLTDRWEREEARTFGKGDLVFLGVPVYFGRVPLPMQSLAKWTGNGAAAVPVAAYGCRAHEDTLRELAAVLRAAGFVVPAGAAFPVEHSQFPEFGAGPPNEADRFSAGDFARRVFEALRDGTARFAPEFPGEGELRPYPKTGFVPMPDPVCRMCGRCAEVCPMDIIDPFSMRVKDPSQCIGCRACARICAHGAPTFTDNKASIDPNKCVGCGRCIGVCPKDAIEPSWGQAEGLLDKKMAEYALAVVYGRPQFHISLVMDVSPYCDCHPENDNPIVPNIGMFASFDPVALDQACADAVNAQHPIADSVLGEHGDQYHDHFKDVSPITDWKLQLDHAEKIGLGTRSYELIKI